MIISPQSLDTNLSQLLDEVDAGKTQLPEFRRDWTWDDNRIKGIIASLSQGYPMGAIMRLQYGNPDIRFKYRTIKGVGDKDVTPDYSVDIFYVWKKPKERVGQANACPNSVFVVI